MSKLGSYAGALLLFTLGTQDVLAANLPALNFRALGIDRIQQSHRPNLPVQVAQAENVIYVSPNASSGYSSITAALSSNPQAGTVIQLASGTYSTASGEVFPLKIPAGVILRGEPSSKGTSVVIQGGGRFVSPTFASQNIAIALGSNAQLDGVTVTNKNPRGYGVWIESSKNVTISNNTLLGNTHDGVFLTGSANAAIANNLFTRNTGSGISAVGTSTGQITNNVFDNTGFGLSIAQRSQVALFDNRIINNVDGVVITNDAQPTLRGNLIANNNRNGLVVLRGSFGQTGPDLGITSNPGKNVFRDNREKDINNASGIALIAAGNQINPSRVSGGLNLLASISPVIVPERVVTPPRIPPVRTTLNPPVRSQDPIFTQSPIVPVEPSTLPPKLPSTGKVIPPPTATTGSPVSILIERELPPVRSGGSTINPSVVPVAPRVALDPRTGKAFQFRVMVPATSTSVVQRVRAIVPDAFLNASRSQIQVGAYSDRKDADTQVQKLAQSGIKAIVEPFNR
jgi:parallel beta-helix repeat protein